MIASVRISAHCIEPEPARFANLRSATPADAPKRPEPSTAVHIARAAIGSQATRPLALVLPLRLR